jgi:plasminogen activator inhibitor 1 RNA-binding protein
MATLNPFDILGVDDNDDPSQLMAVAQKAEVKKATKVHARKGTQPRRPPSSQPSQLLPLRLVS